MARLTKSENILDTLLGSTLLAQYYYFTRRCAEGHHEASGRFAHGCSAHCVVFIMG
jgi:hypothetical protein